MKFFTNLKKRLQRQYKRLQLYSRVDRSLNHIHVILDASFMLEVLTKKAGQERILNFRHVYVPFGILEQLNYQIHSLNDEVREKAKKVKPFIDGMVNDLWWWVEVGSHGEIIQDGKTAMALLRETTLSQVFPNNDDQEAQEGQEEFKKLLWKKKHVELDFDYIKIDHPDVLGGRRVKFRKLRVIAAAMVLKIKNPRKTVVIASRDRILQAIAEGLGIATATLLEKSYLVSRNLVGQS